MINPDDLTDAIRVEMNNVLTDLYMNNEQKDVALYALGKVAKRFSLVDLGEDISDLRLNLEGVA